MLCMEEYLIAIVNYLNIRNYCVLFVRTAYIKQKFIKYMYFINHWPQFFKLSCNMSTRDLPDMYAQSPKVAGPG